MKYRSSVSECFTIKLFPLSSFIKISIYSDESFNLPDALKRGTVLVSPSLYSHLTVSKTYHMAESNNPLYHNLAYRGHNDFRGYRTPHRTHHIDWHFCRPYSAGMSRLFYCYPL